MMSERVLNSAKFMVLAICAFQIMLVWIPFFNTRAGYTLLPIPPESTPPISLVASLCWLVAVIVANGPGSRNARRLWLTFPLGVPYPATFIIMIAMWPKF
ncbi:hypothetical protein ABIB57_004655 [Devosia sp. UYZn731]